MPAVALSLVVESGPGGQDLAAGTWQRLQALPDPRSPQGRIYPLACLIAIAVYAFTAARNDRFTMVAIRCVETRVQAWAVLTMAEAMPTSVRLTPRVAVGERSGE